VEEIRGSLDYYLAQSQSVIIDRLLVTGGGSRMAGLMERLQSQVGARVEPGRPLAGMRIGRQVGLDPADLADNEALLTVPIGLALAGEQRRGLRRINLVPREVAAVRQARRQTVLAGTGVAAVGALLLGLWATQASKIDDERQATAENQRETDRLQREVATLGDTIKLDAELDERRAQVQTALSTDVAWTKLFNEIATVLPNDVWLTSFNGEAGKEVQFSAKGFDQTSTARWLLRMGELTSLSGLWVPNSAKDGNDTVSFTSDAALTAAANSKRVDRYMEEKP